MFKKNNLPPTHKSVVCTGASVIIMISHCMIARPHMSPVPTLLRPLIGPSGYGQMKPTGNQTAAKHNRNVHFCI